MFHGVNCSLLRLHSTTVQKSILMNVLRHCFIVVQSQFTSGHANLRMLSPNEWRLTLVLLVFLWGSTSDTFPYTSLEIASTSPVWSLIHSSKSPGSSIRPIPENGHSPEIFRSFNFAQNILSAYPHLLVTCKCLHFGHASPVSVGNSIPTSWHSQGSEEKKRYYFMRILSCGHLSFSLSYVINAPHLCQQPHTISIVNYMGKRWVKYHYHKPMKTDRRVDLANRCASRLGS